MSRIKMMTIVEMGIMGMNNVCIPSKLDVSTFDKKCVHEYITAEK